LFEPLVSIVILNYKRLDALELTLESVAGQNYARTEVIVVDNHSEQDVAGVVSRFGSQIHLIELETNLGACGGRNAGIRSAAGDIIITLDNDVSFLSPSAIDRVVAIFRERPDFHVLAFQLRDAVTGSSVEIPHNLSLHPKLSLDRVQGLSGLGRHPLRRLSTADDVHPCHTREVPVQLPSWSATRLRWMEQDQAATSEQENGSSHRRP
jgi:glycosyltransferase involved in cell wall biosynthesis